MRIILPSAAFAGLAVIALAAGAASAQDARTDNPRDASRANWMSMGEIVTKIEGQGRRVHEIEIDDGVYEVKAIDASGMRVEADLDPTTGEPIRGWRQDD